MKFRAELVTGTNIKPTAQARNKGLKTYAKIWSLMTQILKAERELKQLVDNCKHTLCYEHEEDRIKRCSVCNKEIEIRV